MKKRLRLPFILLCAMGAVLSSMSLKSHYATDATSYCDLNATFNCDIVNRSSFSEIFGIPVALIGLMGYLALFSTAWLAARPMALARLAMTIAGLSFALYLAYIEEHVLGAWCLLCIGSLAAIAGLALVSVLELKPRVSTDKTLPEKW